MQQAPMSNMHDTFWHNNQVIITFYSDKRITDFTMDFATEFLDKHLVNLNKFLESRSPLTLSFLSKKDTLSSIRNAPPGVSEAEKSSEHDIYCFTWPSRRIPSMPVAKAMGDIRTCLVGIFSIHDVHSRQHNMADDTRPSSADISREANMGQESVKMGAPASIAIGPVASIVNLLNGYVAESKNVTGTDRIPVLAAEPVWYCGATGDIPQGCPISPPIPVPADVNCTSSPGFFPFELPLGLMPDTIGDSGNGVTVCILDSLPAREQITHAARVAGENNKLLLEIEKNGTFCYDYDHLVNAVDKSSRLAVGKDIYGRHSHFKLPDHGLFVAGIIHSIASKASIECIRVLNDYCIGDMQVLLKTLQDIHNRMLPGGNLHGKPVVINMSLVIPTDEEAQQMGIKLDPGSHNMIRASLFGAIESLAELGAVFVASAGNEGDMRDNPSRTVPNALYPAAFAEDNSRAVVSVGAANSGGTQTTYSCFPGLNGIAVFGGEIAKPVPSGCFTRASAVDELIGIYSSPSYPALSIDDCEPTYPAPNNNAWAYWAGTSFATPIISAVVARILEKDGVGNRDIMVAVSNAVGGHPITWTNLDPASNPDRKGGTEFVGRMIRVTQCRGNATG